MQQYQFFACEVVWLGKGILCTSKHNYGTCVSRPGLIEQCFPFPLILLSMRSSSRSDCASDHCRCICVYTGWLFFGIRVSLFSWVLSCVSCHAHNRVAGLKSASVLGVCAPLYGMGSPLILVSVRSLPNVTPSAPFNCASVARWFSRILPAVLVPTVRLQIRRFWQGSHFRSLLILVPVFPSLNRDRSVQVRQHTVGVHLQAWMFDMVRPHTGFACREVTAIRELTGRVIIIIVTMRAVLLQPA